ncbi:Phospholipid/glycerol acyltransferase [Euzebya pacifica]|uniref:Phospholipid/glycerol acyltransferase n=1 Tax=Euzebya pacifica TaxID=1608957 RepID=A0A346Y4N2_9ACTN|nr:lysophospholipid acyltransferase family protein [Euzebya pacifica]AXV09429.1 Phospholipid/glycerol acyltransferase [Euzebya pacifica]
MTDHRGAEVISLDERRRPIGPADQGRQRCQRLRADGSACRLYLDEEGRCRVCEPTTRAAHPSSGGRQGRRTHLGPDVPILSDRDLADLEQVVRGVLAFSRRRLTGDYDVDDYGFDRDFTEQVVMPLARPLYQRWWRIRTDGIHNIPDTGGALLVANHAGTVPFDAIMTKLAVFDEHPAHRHVRELAADLVMKVPLLGPMARKSGNTLANGEDAVRLLDSGELVGVWPEGFKGIGKAYRDRYKLQRFGRGGFVEVAIRTGVPIVPVATIGSEEIFPIVANVKPLARILGLPYFPITWQFPLLGPLGLVPLPSKWVIEFGEPIPTAHLGPDAADDPMLVFELTDRVRDTIQQMIYRNLMGRRSVFF